jgi:16S rRNA (guanine527-N7)-methyltransferase
MPAPAGAPVENAAAVVFGDRLELATSYVAYLETVGVPRGLLGPREVSRLWERHVLNCAVVTDLCPEGSTVYDVGSGAGLPGIPWAIRRPDLDVTLLEPLLRRATFLGECVTDLGLSNVTVRRARAEDVTASAGIVTARAVAPLARLVGWTLPLVRPGGDLLAIKGSTAADEVPAADAVAGALGGSKVEIVSCGVGLLETPTVVLRVRKSRSARTTDSRRRYARRSR